MLKSILLLIAGLLSNSIYAQNVSITNELSLSSYNYSEIPSNALEIKRVYIKSKPSLSMFLLGVGSIDVDIVVPGLKACARFKHSDNIVFIINSTYDSTSLFNKVKVIKLKQDDKKLYCYSEFKRWTTFTGNKYLDNAFVPFTISKINDHQYTINIQSKLESGEYAIRLPDDTGQVRLFGID